MPLSLLQCILLAAGQVWLKFALQQMLPFGWNRAFWWSLFGNWQFAACGLCFGGGSLLWMYILKNYEFSLAYPITSMTFVFSIFAGYFVFGEAISISKLVGVALITLGIVVIATGK